MGECSGGHHYNTWPLDKKPKETFRSEGRAKGNKKKPEICFWVVNQSVEYNVKRTWVDGQRERGNWTRSPLRIHRIRHQFYLAIAMVSDLPKKERVWT